MTDDPPPMIVCQTCRSLPHPVAGSTVARCLECREPVWLSPASRQVAIENECAPICAGCVSTSLASGDVHVYPPTESQLEELKHGKGESSHHSL